MIKYLAGVSFSALLFLSFAINADENLKSLNLLEANIDKILRTQKSTAPGISLLVKKGNEIIFRRNKGLAVKSDNLAISSNTGFRVGSISKPFAAVAILQLFERGKISLDDSVRNYIKALPARWQPITIRHLLAHRVSVSDDFFAEKNVKIANKATNQDVIRFLSKNNITVRARNKNKAIYCNVCYVLLAEVIAKVSGDNYATFIENNIFLPAKMEHSYIVDKGVDIKAGDALNYAQTQSFFGIVQYTTGAMAQVSSAEDLSNFVFALKENILLNKANVQLMRQVHSDMGSDGLYGFGWLIGTGKKPFYAHGGSQDGYEAELFLDPNNDVEVIILSNGGDKTYALMERLMRTILAYFRD